MTDQRPLVATILEAWVIAMLCFDAAVAELNRELNGTFVMTSVIYLALILSVTRLRSGLARWIFTAMTLLGLAIIFLAETEMGISDLRWIDVALVGSVLVDLALIWTSSMSMWIRSKPDRRDGVGLFRALGTIALLMAFFYALSSMLGLWGA